MCETWKGRREGDMMERGIARCTNHSFVWLECYSTCFKQLKPQWELRLIGSGKRSWKNGGGEGRAKKRRCKACTWLLRTHCCLSSSACAWGGRSSLPNPFIDMMNWPQVCVRWQGRRRRQPKDGSCVAWLYVGASCACPLDGKACTAR